MLFIYLDENFHFFEEYLGKRYLELFAVDYEQMILDVGTPIGHPGQYYGVIPSNTYVSDAHSAIINDAYRPLTQSYGNLSMYQFIYLSQFIEYDIGYRTDDDTFYRGWNSSNRMPQFTYPGSYSNNRNIPCSPTVVEMIGLPFDCKIEDIVKFFEYFTKLYAIILTLYYIFSCFDLVVIILINNRFASKKIEMDVSMAMRHLNSVLLKKQNVL